MSTETKLRPLYVQVHPQDTVAIIVNEGGLPAGAQFDSGLTLIEDVPEAHKVALVDIKSGAPILRYGSVIGYAKRTFRRGGWVHEERVQMPVAACAGKSAARNSGAVAAAPTGRLYLRGVPQRRRLASAPRTSSESRPLCNASRRLWTTRLDGSRRRFCRAIRMWTT